MGDKFKLDTNGVCMYSSDDDEITVSAEFRAADIEKRILGIIDVVKNRRNRPCYQSIHEHITRELQYRDISKEELRQHINNLLKDNIIRNVGTEDKESYRMQPNPNELRDATIRTVDTSEWDKEIETLKKQIDSLITELKQKNILIEKLSNDLHINSTIDSEYDESFDSRSSQNDNSFKEYTTRVTDILSNHLVGEEVDSNDERDDAQNLRMELYQIRDDYSAFTKYVYDELSLVKKKLGLEVDRKQQSFSVGSAEDALAERLVVEKAWCEDTCKDTEEVGTNGRWDQKTMDAYDEMLVRAQTCQIPVDATSEFKWQNYSSGVPREILDGMGYKGEGLGKNEDGMKEAVGVILHEKMMKKDTPKEQPKQHKKTLYILSDSMMGGIEEERLKNSLVDKVSDIRKLCDGGCKVDGMSKHIAKLVKYKPNIVLIHVGTNDCVDSTSDTVITKLETLVKKIEENVPTTRVYLSLPTMRMDNTRANLMVRNVNTKIRRSGLRCVDHLNIKKHHLSKKGLHLNDHGTRLMASNIISFIKQL